MHNVTLGPEPMTEGTHFHPHTHPFMGHNSEYTRLHKTHTHPATASRHTYVQKKLELVFVIVAKVLMWSKYK